MNVHKMKFANLIQLVKTPPDPLYVSVRRATYCRIRTVLMWMNVWMGQHSVSRFVSTMRGAISVAVSRASFKILPQELVQRVNLALFNVVLELVQLWMAYHSVCVQVVCSPMGVHVLAVRGTLLGLTAQWFAIA
jgi:hypothetical protein